MGDVYFNLDRLKKYGYGVPRLLILAWAAFAIAPSVQNVADQDFGLQACVHLLNPPSSGVDNTTIIMIIIMKTYH
jgi:hypothetical protein